MPFRILYLVIIYCLTITILYLQMNECTAKGNRLQHIPQKKVCWNMKCKSIDEAYSWPIIRLMLFLQCIMLICSLFFYYRQHIRYYNKLWPKCMSYDINIKLDQVWIGKIWLVVSTRERDLISRKHFLVKWLKRPWRSKMVSKC